jgi:transcription elongation factor Elf1
MPMPCCPKCSKTHFLRTEDKQLSIVLIYCGSCGAAVGAIPAKTQPGKSKTTPDDWTANV